MKYKLLIENGCVFLCLESGVRFPYQIKSVVTQDLTGDAVATVSAYVDSRVGSSEDKRLSLGNDSHTLHFDGKRLQNLRMLNIYDQGEESLVCVEFTVNATYGDTVEKPINPNRKA